MFQSEASKVIATSLAGLLSRGLSILLFLVLTPMLYGGLGDRLYGIFQFAQRLTVFGGATNVGATSYLKIRLSALSRDGTTEERQSAVGDCLLQWLVLSPTIALYCWLGGEIVTREMPLGTQDYIAVLMLLALAPVGQFFSIPQVALFAHGLGYRGTLASTIVTLAGSAFAAFAAQAGYGLAGVAIGLTLGTILSGIWTLVLTRRLLGWFGFRWPRLSTLWVPLARGSGASVASLAYLGLQQAEALSFGLIDGPAVLGHVVITCAGVQIAELLVRYFVAASNPSVAPLVAAGESDRLNLLRADVYANTSVIFALAAPVLILLSSPLVSLWVAQEAFLSPEVVAAVLLVAYFRVLAQFDGQLQDQDGDFYAKVALAALVVFAPVGAIIGLAELGYRFEAWYWALPVAMLLYQLLNARRCERVLQLKPLTSLTLYPVAAVAVGLFAEYLVDRFFGWPGARAVAALAAELPVFLLLFSSSSVRRSSMLLLRRFSRMFAEMRSRRRQS